MKVDLVGESFDPCGYDRDHGGDGAAAAIIASLQATGDANNEAIAKTHADATFLAALTAKAYLEEESSAEYLADGTFVVTLGIGDHKDKLEPVIKKALEDNKDK